MYSWCIQNILFSFSTWCFPVISSKGEIFWKKTPHSKEVSHDKAFYYSCQKCLVFIQYHVKFGVCFANTSIWLLTSSQGRTRILFSVWMFLEHVSYDTSSDKSEIKNGCFSVFVVRSVIHWLKKIVVVSMIAIFLLENLNIN